MDNFDCWVVGFLCGAVFLLLALVIIDPWSKGVNDCARENNVYRCEWVAVPAKMENVK